MMVIDIARSLTELQKINEEIRVKELLQTKALSCGLISFKPIPGRDPKQINHPDKDVLCHVLKGKGRLRMNGEEIPIQHGMVCHVPTGTPHDFAAVDEEMVILYSLITTTQP
jgi:quercetin dioxygenase-like cupin family protein